VNYLLDTDTCIYWLNKRQSVKDKLLAAGWSRTAICSITVAELYYGAYNSSRVAENLRIVELFARQLHVVPLYDNVLRRFGEIKAELRKKGQPLPDFDLLIASVALAENRVLVTNNIRHYERITGLRVENWVSSTP
jgi:tRNA(fMet)-specific endonuclease VapC